MNIIVCGIKHSGKSTLGKLLAKHFNYLHYDLDDLIEKYYFNNFNEHKSIREIFKNYGSDYFHKLERETLNEFIKTNCKDISKCFSCKTQSLLQETSCKTKVNCTVLSLGGGTIENKDLFKTLKNYGLLIYLKATPEVLMQRILRKGLPPFLNKETYVEDFKKLYLIRDKSYCEVSDIIVELKDTPIKRSLSLILKSIEEYVYARKHIR